MNTKAKKHLDGCVKRTIRGEQWVRLEDALKLAELEKVKPKDKK